MVGSVSTINSVGLQTMDGSGLYMTSSTLAGSVLAKSPAISIGSVVPSMAYDIAMGLDLDNGLSPPDGRVDLVEFGKGSSDMTPTMADPITHLLGLPAHHPSKPSSKKSYKKAGKPPIPIKLASTEIEERAHISFNGLDDTIKSHKAKGLANLPATAPVNIARNSNPFSCLAESMDVASASATAQIIITPVVGSLLIKRESPT